jgi:hypothetical protein
MIEDCDFRARLEVAGPPRSEPWCQGTEDFRGNACHPCSFLRRHTYSADGGWWPVPTGKLLSSRAGWVAGRSLGVALRKETIARSSRPLVLEQRLIGHGPPASLADLYRQRNPQPRVCRRSKRACIETVRVTSPDVAAEGGHVVGGSSAAR